MVNETATAFLAEFCNWSSDPAWWKAHEQREIKHYGRSALFVRHWTMEKQLVPVGTVSATAKMTPSNALVSTHVPVMEPVERNLFWVVLLASGRAVSWCRMAGGDPERFMSWVFKQDFARAEQHFASTHPPPPALAGRCYCPPKLADSDCKGGFIPVHPRPKHDLAKLPDLNKCIFWGRIWVVPLPELMFLPTSHDEDLCSFFTVTLLLANVRNT